MQFWNHESAHPGTSLSRFLHAPSSRCPAAQRFACIIREGNWQQSLSECHFYAHQQCVPFVAPPRTPEHAAAAAGTVDSVE